MLGSAGQCLLRVARFGMTYEEASQLAAVLRVPIDPTWDRPITFSELRSEFPGAATWSESHRNLYAAAIMVPVAAFGILITLLARRG